MLINLISNVIMIINYFDKLYLSETFMIINCIFFKNNFYDSGLI